MYYSEELIDKVRQQNDIVDVISSYVSLKKKGSSYFGLCPFHNEKTGSFSVSRSKQMYYCFGCGKGGNVIGFIRDYENYSFVEAVKLLAERAGIELPQVDESKENREKESKRQTLLNINKDTANYFYCQLYQPQGQIGLEYFKKRGLTDETMKQFALGYSNKTSNDLCLYLKKKGYSDELIRESGVAVFSEKYGMSDKFWNRVMFPIVRGTKRDSHVVGFGGRVLGEGEPKYLNSPETMVFDKSQNLYGLNFARTSRKNNIILCEGYMDVITMHQAGFTQAVASLGTAFTSGQARLLKGCTENVILSYDSDGAGVKAALRAIGILKEAGLSGKVLNLEPYKDPDEFIKNLGAEAFEKRIEQAENSFFFELRILQKNYDLSDPDAKTRFYKAVANKLCGFSEEVERENYIEAVAQKYNIGRDALRKLVVGQAAKEEMTEAAAKVRRETRRKASPEERAKMMQSLLLTWLSEQPKVYPIVKRYISVEDFTDELYAKVAQMVFDGLEQGNLDPAGILSKFEDEQQEEIARIFHTKLNYMQETDVTQADERSKRNKRDKAFRDILLGVKHSSYDYYLKKSGEDVDALQQMVKGKMELEALEKANISLDQGKTT